MKSVLGGLNRVDGEEENETLEQRILKDMKNQPK